MSSCWLYPVGGIVIIACSQLFGVGHSRMRGFYTIQTQADFDAWLADQAAQLVPAKGEVRVGTPPLVHQLYDFFATLPGFGAAARVTL